MKKKPIVVVFLLMALLILGSIPVSAANEPFVWNDIELHFMGYRLSDGGPSPYLSLYVRGINNSDHRIWINVEDAKVDGAPVFSAGRTLDPYSDTGVDSPKILTFMAYDDAGEDVYEAIRNAHTIEMTIVLEDSDTYEHICDRDVTLDLTAWEEGATDYSAAYSSSVPVPSSETPPATSTSSYRTLQTGDRGDDVKRLQEKLIELGYLNDTADGSFGPMTAAAVQRFNEANGLRYDGIADAITQDCLYSGLANSYTEPWIPVDLPYTEWNDITGDGASYRLKVTNLSATRTIKGIEIQYYPTDVWGNNLWDYPNRKTTFTMTIYPGESEYTGWFYMSPSWYTIDQLHWAVTRIVFDDGTIRENDDITNWDTSLH